MRKNYFLTGIVVLFLTAVISNSCKNSMNKTAETGKTQDSIGARIRRGDHLVNAVCICMSCHAERDSTKFAGPVIPGTEGKGGEQIIQGIYVRNITPYTLGNWTDKEVYRVMTTGIRQNGDTLFPIMPYAAYAKMPKEEIYSIIAYLRTLKPIKNNVPERKLDSYPPGFLATLYKSLYLKHVQEKMPLPSPDDKVKLGTYLVNNAGCKDCHTKFDMKKLDWDMDEYLSGGNKAKVGNSQVTPANITPDTATAIGRWTEEMFLAKFKNYRDSSSYNYDPGKYNSFMPWTIFARMTDEDLKAIYA